MSICPLNHYLFAAILFFILFTQYCSSFESFVTNIFGLFLMIGCGLSSSGWNALSLGLNSAPGSVASARSSGENNNFTKGALSQPFSFFFFLIIGSKKGEPVPVSKCPCLNGFECPLQESVDNDNDGSVDLLFRIWLKEKGFNMGLSGLISLYVYSAIFCLKTKRFLYHAQVKLLLKWVQWSLYRDKLV